jgi:hypothetical protein
MSMRLVINILILIVSTIAVGILLYVICNLKKVLNKLLTTGLTVIKENETKIQPIINNFANNTAIDILNSKALDKPLTQQSTRVITEKDTQNAVGKLLDSQPVKQSINNAIISTLSNDSIPNDSIPNDSHIFYSDNSTMFEKVLAQNIRSPIVSSSIANAVKNY